MADLQPDFMTWDVALDYSSVATHPHPSPAQPQYSQHQPEYRSEDAIVANHASNGYSSSAMVNPQQLVRNHHSSGSTQDRAQAHAQAVGRPVTAGPQGHRPNQGAPPTGNRTLPIMEPPTMMPRNSEARFPVTRQFEEQSRAIRNVQQAQQELMGQVLSKLERLDYLLNMYIENSKKNFEKLYKAQATVEEYLADISQVKQGQDNGDLDVGAGY